MSMDSLRALFEARLPEYCLVSAEPLSGGLSNRCWVVVIEHRQNSLRHTLVWRPTSSSSLAFGVSRQQEHNVLRAISSSSLHEIAPCPFALFPEGLLVEWVAGQTALQALPCETLMATLVTIHQLPVPSHRLDCRQRTAHYWRNIGGATDDPQLRRIHAYFQARPITAWFADTCCHHDLGGYNIITAPNGRYSVIDWEYASAGDPSLDLALTIAANQLDLKAAVAQYCQSRGIKDVACQARWQAAVAYWQPWCDYMAMLWFYVGAQLFSTLQQPDDDYLNQALALKEKLWGGGQFTD
ncbi:hypothetical protein H744_2c1460 [Photobacterium gaetbulicola Gung47]|uniref:Aminoglycoside phosphotransferase domain-containing protein n=1 Tax=Photobacterium gaetbulicola Gung47 TaxID=658445 RepID=A0A0C5WLU5_9GAMM|nr:phosphotransferase [Photobacterium gaetbulicola]AJR08138.1 hypothetical protein H744_2c1460 [Photobacterium gaetbulicola Gung47]